LVGVTILLNCHIWALSHAGRHIRRALVNICNYCLLPGGNRLRVALKRECNRNASLFRFEEHLLVHELWLFEEVRMLYTLAFVTQGIEGWQLQLKFRHSVCTAYLLSTRLLEQGLAVPSSLLRVLMDGVYINFRKGFAGVEVVVESVLHALRLYSYYICENYIRNFKFK